MPLKSFAQRLVPSRCSLTDDVVIGEDDEVRPERLLEAELQGVRVLLRSPQHEETGGALAWTVATGVCRGV